MDNAMDELIRLYQERAEKALQAKQLVAKLKDLIAGDAAFAAEILKALTQPADHADARSPALAAPAPNVKGTYLNRILGFFRATSNEWATVDQVSSAINVDRNSFVGLLYRFKGKKFEQRRHPKIRKLRQWRVQEAVAAADSLKEGGGQ